VSRNPDSVASQKLVARGVEVVKANLDNPASLGPAVEGADAVFAVTDFWAPVRNPANESKVKPRQTVDEWDHHNEM
jgi:uncharacterized protein YbjT (DUF2867 family)